MAIKLACELPTYKLSGMFNQNGCIPYLLFIEVILEIDKQQAAVLRSIKACQGRAKDLKPVACITECIIKAVVVGVRMIAMPIQDVIANIQGVSWDVARGVANIVELTADEKKRLFETMHLSPMQHC